MALITRNSEGFLRILSKGFFFRKYTVYFRVCQREKVCT